MANLLDYLVWRGDLSFRAAPFCDVDNLILCALSYIGYTDAAAWDSGESLPLSQAAQWFESQSVERQHIRSHLDPELLRLAGSSARFGSVRLCRFFEKFRPEEELQFCAMTFLLDDETAFVAYRGTDSTLVGWKEDFNMSFKPLVPAQAEAAAYLNSLEALPQKRLLVGGHSKGGNLAIYASASCSAQMQSRIAAVYSNDGPGFVPEFLQTPQYLAIRDRILLLVPQSSIIGRMLKLDAKCRVVHSMESGLDQHDPYTWELSGPDFVSEEQVDAASLVIDRTLKGWLELMTPEEREEFVNQMYLAFRSTNVSTLREFSEEKARNSALLFRALREAPQSTRRFMLESTKKFLSAFRASLGAQFKSSGSEKKLALEDRLHRMELLVRRMEEDASDGSEGED